MKKSFGGFTLVEVLIVIILVSILIATMSPRLIGSQARARNTARSAHLHQIAHAITLFVAENPMEAENFSWCATQLFADYEAFSAIIATMPEDPRGVSDIACPWWSYGVWRTQLDNKFVVCGEAENNWWNATEPWVRLDWDWLTYPWYPMIQAPWFFSQGTHMCVVVDG